MKYLIVTSEFGNPVKSNPGQSLPEKVQKRLDKGWRLQGGVSVGHGGAGSERSMHIGTIYAQAMVKD